MKENFMNPGPCPICQGPLMQLPNNLQIDGQHIRCFNCGEHDFTESTLRVMSSRSLETARRAAVAHQVRKLPAGQLVTSDLIESMLKTATLPPALERIDNLVQTLASEYGPGESPTLEPSHLRAALGCVQVEAAGWVLKEAVLMGLVNVNGVYEVTLTARGWARYAELRQGGAGSRHAFMAMAFNDEMWDLWRDWLKPAVAAAGFELRPVAGAHQTAGSIDNRMRVEIRTSRFMVCDLTHSNRGAYWEAGFAEGLGRPVFYTCRRDVLTSTEPTTKPHFDTAHQLIIPWSTDTIEADMQQLTDAIRATLPGEAWQEDRQGR